MPTDILWKNLKDREGDRRITLRRIGETLCECDVERTALEYCSMASYDICGEKLRVLFAGSLLWLVFLPMYKMVVLRGLVVSLLNSGHKVWCFIPDPKQ
jgi:hypothetical protein